MRHCTIRIDNILEDTYNHIQEFLTTYDYISKYLIYHEISDEEQKPHFQGRVDIEDDTISESKRKKDFREFFNKKDMRYAPTGVKSYALIRNLETYSIYTTKDYDLKFNKGFSFEEIATLESQSFKKSKCPKTKNNKAKSYSELLVEEYRVFATNKVSGNLDKNKLENEVIILFLLEKYASKCKGFNDFQIISQVNMIKNCLYDKTSRNHLAFSLANKLQDKII